MQTMGLEAIYPKRTTVSHQQHEIYPYLLRDVVVDKPDQVWGTDITYVPMSRGFLYLVAIIDWYSRYVLSWALSNALDTAFCIDALTDAFRSPRRPDIFNSDQGCQFTALAFVSMLKQENIRISMDGRGRALDNVFSERLWRTVKYEEIYLRDYTDGFDARDYLDRYFRFYNEERPHQSLDYRTPHEVYFGERN
jgi:putative transposase